MRRPFIRQEDSEDQQGSRQHERWTFSARSFQVKKIPETTSCEAVKGHEAGWGFALCMGANYVRPTENDSLILTNYLLGIYGKSDLVMEKYSLFAVEQRLQNRSV